MYRKYCSQTDLEMLLPDQVFEQMKKTCRRYYPREVGGILVGHIENGITAVVELMIVPKWFYSTPVFFRRKEAYINQKLQKIWKQSNGMTHYLGEWHCHPNMTSNYSGTDLKAMTDIAANPNIRMKNPIMIIIGYKPPEFAETLYLFSDGVLHKCERKI